MIQNVNFNGKLFPSNQTLISIDNRGLKYGDGLFETIRVFEGKIPFLQYHLDRLIHGLKVLKFELPGFYSVAYFEKEIGKLTNEKGNHRIRISVFRSPGGLYTPTNNQPQFLIENNFLKDSLFRLNKKGLQIGIFKEMKISYNILSGIKTCNSLPFILAGLYCEECLLDDCILLNDGGNIAECSGSNIFVLNGNVISTPSLSQSCINGTMRKIVIKIAQERHFLINETTIKVEDLKHADEIWLTNAIHGIKWVKNFEGQTFDNKIAKDFVKLLNEKITEN